MAEAKIRITADTAQAERALGSLTRSLGALVTVAAVSALAKQFMDLSDAATNLQNKLNLVTQEGQTSAQAFALMAATANNLGAPMKDVGDLFFRIANNTKDLGLTQVEQLRITELLIKGFQLTGQSMAETQGAITQLGQAFSQGVLRGDELNSVLEALPMVADALAQKLGVTRGALKALGEAGRISSKDLKDAILESGVALDQAYLQRIPTIQNAFNVLKNTFDVLAQKTTEATGINQVFSYALLIVADAVITVYEWFQKWGKVILYTIEILGSLFLAFKAYKLIMAIWEGVGAAIAFVAKNVKSLLTVMAPLLTFLGINVIEVNKSLEELFSTDKESMADKYQKKLEEINKRLGIDTVQAVNKAKAATGGLTSQQVKDADAVKKATINRNEELRKIIQTQKDAVALTQFDNNELKIQEVILNANKSLIQAIKNDKGEIIGYTKGLNAEEENTLRTLKMQEIQGTILRDLKVELRKNTEDLNFILANANRLTNEQLEAELQILDIQRQLGQELDSEIQQKIRSNAETQRQIEYIKTIKQGLDSVNKVLTGPAAGAAAAGQLGNLDPIRAAQTAQETLFNGLEYLRQNDLISEQQYLDAKLRANQDFQLKMAELQEDRATKEYQIQQKLLEIEVKRIERVLMANTTGIAQILTEEQRATLQKVGQQERMKAIVSERIEFEKKSEVEKAQFAIQQGATIFSALGAQNKRAFEAAKAFNMANAIMNTYMAATKALATYPWPFGLVAAAAAVASGLAQVAQIRAQTYSGRALGGPVMGGNPYIVGESGPELFVPGTTGSIVRNDQLGGKNVTVNFQIVANDTTGFDQLLYSRRGMITQIINDAVLEKGKRSIA